MPTNPDHKKIVLLVEDDTSVTKTIRELFQPYGEQMALEEAETAQQAMSKLFTDEKNTLRVDALILDLMMPYESSDIQMELKGEGDTMTINTGIHLLDYIRKKEKEKGWAPLWVDVITARNAPNVLQRVNDLLGENGRLLTKPFNECILEQDTALVLGIESQVDPFLLPDGYEPPQRTAGGAK